MDVPKNSGTEGNERHHHHHAERNLEAQDVTKPVTTSRSGSSGPVFEDGIGYIRISSFQERTAEDLSKALAEVEKKAHPLKGLVLDLRNNPGGLLGQAVQVSELFLKSGTIVSTRGRVKSVESSAKARDNGNEPTCAIVALVNEAPPSARRSLPAPFRITVAPLSCGTQTFVKGSVQTVIPLD